MHVPTVPGRTREGLQLPSLPSAALPSPVALSTQRHLPGPAHTPPPLLPSCQLPHAWAEGVLLRPLNASGTREKRRLSPWLIIAWLVAAGTLTPRNDAGPRPRPQRGQASLKLSCAHPGLLARKAAGFLAWLTQVETEAQRKACPRPLREGHCKNSSWVSGLEVTFSFCLDHWAVTVCSSPSVTMTQPGARGEGRASASSPE